jgi:hypothetical protein
VESPGGPDLSVADETLLLDVTGRHHSGTPLPSSSKSECKTATAPSSSSLSSSLLVSSQPSAVSAVFPPSSALQTLRSTQPDQCSMRPPPSQTAPVEQLSVDIAVIRQACCRQKHKGSCPGQVKLKNELRPHLFRWLVRSELL